jgi:hypothetical protein
MVCRCVPEDLDSDAGSCDYDSGKANGSGEAGRAGNSGHDRGKAGDCIGERRTCCESGGNATGCWRGSGTGVAEHREQRIPLPRLNLLWQD